MDNSSNSYDTNCVSFVKKKYIFIGILFLILISFSQFFRLTNPQTAPIYLATTKQYNKSTFTTISNFISTTTTTSVLSKLLTNTIQSNSTTTTTINLDEILCDNFTEYRPQNLSQNPCERIRCVVLLRAIGGRLGNHMFIFASAYGLARVHNCRLHVSQSILNGLLNNFQMKSIDEKMWLSEREITRLKNIQIKNTVCSFQSELLIPNAFQNMELHGYWQSYLYFDLYREEIREMFSARNDATIRLAKYFTDITRKFCSTCSSLPNTTYQDLRQAFRTRYNITWISIHIRRQDFRGLGYSSDDHYIRRAITLFRRRYYQHNVRFLVASDDRTYCRELFASEQKSGRILILPDHFSPADDLMALSLCHHSIVTGGTYGFWSAYLAGGDVIHDVRYKTGCSQADYYPPWFMLIGPIADNKG